MHNMIVLLPITSQWRYVPKEHVWPWILSSGCTLASLRLWADSKCSLGLRLLPELVNVIPVCRCVNWKLSMNLSHPHMISMVEQPVLMFFGVVWRVPKPHQHPAVTSSWSHSSALECIFRLVMHLGAEVFTWLPLAAINDHYQWNLWYYSFQGKAEGTEESQLCSEIYFSLPIWLWVAVLSRTTWRDLLSWCCWLHWISFGMSMLYLTSQSAPFRMSGTLFVNHPLWNFNDHYWFSWAHMLFPCADDGFLLLETAASNRCIAAVLILMVEEQSIHNFCCCCS